MMNPYRLLRLLVLACPMAAAPLLAHDPGFSATKIRLTATGAEAVVEFNNEDFARRLLPAVDFDRDGRIRSAELRAGRDRIEQFFATQTGLHVGDARLPGASLQAYLGEEQDVSCRIVWEFDHAATQQIEWRVAALQRLARGHRQYCAILAAPGVPLAESLLTPQDWTLRAELGPNAAPPSPLTTATQFLELGIEHILIGYDHILFLLGLLLVCASARHVVVTISMFTLAHSVTLVAASFGVLALPGVLVESAIAGSIVYVGIKNLARQGRPESGSPWVAPLLFGLLHGFGFASVLGELGVAEAGGVVVPVIAFNLGVEVGQLLIAALVLPVLWLFARRSAGRHVAVLGSLGITVAGAWWLIERTLLA